MQLAVRLVSCNSLIWIIYILSSEIVKLLNLTWLGLLLFFFTKSRINNLHQTSLFEIVETKSSLEYLVLKGMQQVKINNKDEKTQKKINNF